MELFVVVFVVLCVWICLAAGGSARARRAGDASLGCIAIIGMIAALAIFVALPATIVLMMLASAFA